MQDHPTQHPPPVFNLPPVTRRLAGAVLGFGLLQWLAPFVLGQAGAVVLLYRLCLVPARLTDPRLFDALSVPSLLTHMFLHGGLAHIAMNVLCLLAFGAGLEKRAGGRAVLLLAFLSGLGGAVAQIVLAPHSLIPMLGASGAISGLFGAIVVLMQHAQGRSGFKALAPMVLLWVVVSVFFGLLGMPGVEGQVAWAAHIGGFVTGLALCRPVLRLLQNS